MTLHARSVMCLQHGLQSPTKVETRRSIQLGLYISELRAFPLAYCIDCKKVPHGASEATFSDIRGAIRRRRKNGMMGDVDPTQSISDHKL